MTGKVGGVLNDLRGGGYESGNARHESLRAVAGLSEAQVHGQTEAKNQSSDFPSVLTFKWSQVPRTQVRCKEDFKDTSSDV